jgi:hypothetical protein
MAQLIGTQTGIVATRSEMEALAPGKPGHTKLLGQPGLDYGFGPVEGTIQKLVNGHNEYEARIAALEAAAANSRFPG